MTNVHHPDNHEAIRLLFELFAQRVLAAAYYVVRDQVLAEDIMQETFATAMQKLDQLRDPDKAGAWLCRIAVNKAHTQMRKKNKTVPINMPLVIPDDTGETLLLREETEQLHRALDALNQDYKLVVYLRYYREMSVKKIAEVLEIPEGTVKSRLRRARELVGGYYRRKVGVGDV
ncbi:MAG: RNA polymerase sigma factor [Candidatus Desulforudis sp.]|nr:RNA polymerase sigma factor [Desulforudis sp.]